MRFEDLDFQPTDYGGIQATQKFGKYELSVIKEPGKRLFEIAIFDSSGLFAQLPGIHRTPEHDEDFVDDVIPYLSPEQVSGIMIKLASISA